MPECVGRREIRFAAAHFRDFLDEAHQSGIGSEHEGVDQDTCALALGNLFQSLTDHQRVQSKRILVDAAVFHGEGRWLAIGDHDDLLHVFALALQNSLCEAQTFACIGVVGSHFHAG